MQLIGCISAFSLPKVCLFFVLWVGNCLFVVKDSFWLWREQFVMSTDLHTVGKHYRTALLPREACNPDTDRLDERLPSGQLLDQQGNMDDFQVTVECKEQAGCSMLLRVSCKKHSLLRKSCFD
jgi:hypothetical protein